MDIREVAQPHGCQQVFLAPWTCLPRTVGADFVGTWANRHSTLGDIDVCRRHRQEIRAKLATFALIIVAGFAALSLFRRYTTRPWTRDGQIRADVVKVAPRVSGYVVKVAVSDNQQVKAGQLLFEIDPSDYQLTVEHSQVSLDQAREDVEAPRSVRPSRRSDGPAKQRGRQFCTGPN